MLETSDVAVIITVLSFSCASILNFSEPFRSTLSMLLFSSLNSLVKCQVESLPRANIQDRSSPRTTNVQVRITQLGMWHWGKTTCHELPSDPRGWTLGYRAGWLLVWQSIFSLLWKLVEERLFLLGDSGTDYQNFLMPHVLFLKGNQRVMKFRSYY